MTVLLNASRWGSYTTDGNNCILEFTIKISLVPFWTVCTLVCESICIVFIRGSHMDITVYRRPYRLWEQNLSLFWSMSPIVGKNVLRVVSPKGSSWGKRDWVIDMVPERESYPAIPQIKFGYVK